MKFLVLEDFKHAHTSFEAGNNHDSAKLGWDDELVKIYCRAGFISSDGIPSGKMNPSHVEVVPDKLMINIGVQNG